MNTQNIIRHKQRISYLLASRLGANFTYKMTGEIVKKERIQSLMVDELFNVEPFENDITLIQIAQDFIQNQYSLIKIVGDVEKFALVRKDAYSDNYVRIQERDYTLQDDGTLLSVYAQDPEKQNQYLKLIGSQKLRFTEAFELN